jgi:hypothetical protein
MKSNQLITSAVILWASLTVSSVSYAQPSVLTSDQDGLFAVDKQANIWGTNQVEGKYAQQVVKFSGKRTQFSRKAYTGSLIRALKPKNSNVVHNTEGTVEQVWPLPDGTVLFMAGVKGKNYLYKLNPKTNTVGNNNLGNFNNKQAVMNVGESYDSRLKKNVHYEDIRGLHQRSLLVAKVAGKTVLFFGDYNVNRNRVKGGAGDAVGLWQSTDMGNTWRSVVKWNTNGLHAVDHIHGLRQNPYNGWIYILFGDDKDEPGIVAWNGVSRAIPNNTPLANIGLKNRYSGWRALSGTQNVRAGDIVFTKDKCVWLPDRDFIKPGSTLFGQRANHDLTGLQSTNPFYFGNGVSPILAEIDAKGTIYWTSFRSQFNPLAPTNETEKKLYLWTSTDSGFTWSLPVKIDIYNNWTSVPQNLFVSSWGELVLGGRGVIFDDTAKGDASGSSVYLRR